MIKRAHTTLRTQITTQAIQNCTWCARSIGVRIISHRASVRVHVLVSSPRAAAATTSGSKVTTSYGIATSRPLNG